MTNINKMPQSIKNNALEKKAFQDLKIEMQEVAQTLEKVSTMLMNYVLPRDEAKMFEKADSLATTGILKKEAYGIDGTKYKMNGKVVLFSRIFYKSDPVVRSWIERSQYNNGGLPVEVVENERYDQDSEQTKRTTSYTYDNKNRKLEAITLFSEPTQHGNIGASEKFSYNEIPGKIVRYRYELSSGNKKLLVNKSVIEN